MPLFREKQNTGKKNKVKKSFIRTFDADKYLDDYFGSPQKSTKKDNNEYIETTFSGLTPQPTKSESTVFELTENMKKKVILAHPFSCVIVGGTGSGKTSLLSFMLNSTDIYKNYFDEIHAFGRTLRSDAIYKRIKTTKIYTDDLEEEGRKLELKLRKDSEGLGDKKKKKNVLIIFEDLSAEKDVMHKKFFKRLYTQNRHYGVSVIALTHKYKILNRLCRLQAHGVFLFPADMSEIAQIAEDYTPAGATKKIFTKLVQYAHKKTPELQRPFLFINNQAPDERFRKGFTMYLDVPKDFKPQE